ncbi:MAG: phosphoribosylanthranilate isomerase [Bryobacteraceae bacterium]
MMIKICGITNQADALAAVDGGASALGFNFYARSPRYIAPQQAREIAAARPAGVLRVGVFVNQSRDAAAAAARLAGLDVVQLHGDETPADYPDGFRVWRAFRVKTDFRLADLAGITADAIVLDGPAGALFGGAGHAFDWKLAAGSSQRLILAGGLDADNVQQAIAIARPWGVDVCSRIERSPGRKDHARMAAFLKAAQ